MDHEELKKKWESVKKKDIGYNEISLKKWIHWISSTEKKPVRRVYLAPPTSPKIVPKEMKELDKILSACRTEKSDSAKQ